MPYPLYPWERDSGGWVGLRAGLDGRRKSHPPVGFDPHAFQPIVSCYTDCAIPALYYKSSFLQVHSNIKPHYHN